MRAALGPAGLLVIGCLHGQSAAAPPAFDVASIKRSPPGIPGFYLQLLPGGGLRVTAATLRNLLAFAYNVREFEIAGGPGWVAADRFDINARTADSPASSGPPANTNGRRLAADTRERVKALLADRFQLVLHRESREQNVYVLTLAKNGPKFSEAKPDSGNLVRGRAGSITGQGVAIPMLVVNLANQLGRPVLDRTGLNGRYDFKLEWTPDSVRAQPAPETEPAGLSLFTALQEQLGLRLEARKAPVEMLILDRVSQPSEN